MILPQWVRVARGDVFPARAGMILPSDLPDIVLVSIPRESGDDPPLTWKRGLSAGYSPRERG